MTKKSQDQKYLFDLPVSKGGHGVDTQFREYLKKPHIEATSYKSPLPNTTIERRRNVKSRYNEVKGYWELVQPHED